MKTEKLFLVILGFTAAVAPASAYEYWCVAVGERVRLPLPAFVQLQENQVFPLAAAPGGADLVYSGGNDSMTFEVYIDDFESEIVNPVVREDKIDFTAKEEGVAHSIVVLVKRSGIPMALTTPIGIDVRASRESCNN